MPKSRIRKKADFTPPPAKQATNIKLTSRSWVAPVMLALFL
ncbi:cell division protein CrgA, partial [Streptomyces sp. CB02460]